jgi:hypothetical protein
MSSVILNGDTSGSVTLTVPSVAGTNTVTVPSATGTVMVSGNMPAVFAYKDGTPQSITNSTFTKVTFNTELYDTNNNFASSTFTPTVAGYYQISGGISNKNVGGSVFISSGSSATDSAGDVLIRTGKSSKGGLISLQTGSGANNDHGKIIFKPSDKPVSLNYDIDGMKKVYDTSDPRWDEYIELIQRQWPKIEEYFKSRGFYLWSY